ncbi:MAG: dienelactone hydrolase family protein [Paludibacter sp.]
MKKYLLLGILCMVIINPFAQNLKPVQYADGSQKLNGLVTTNAGKKLPGVLILPAWKGIDQEAKTAAVELQKKGYIAFVADIYGEGNIPADNAAAAKSASKYKQDYQAYQRRISLALEELKKAGCFAR